MDIGFAHDDAGDIITMNDNVRPERSQSFAYDPVSRLTQAQGGYGQIDYTYNLVGDRQQKNVAPSDPMIDPFTEDYSYAPDSARLFSVSLNGTPIRGFDYADSGQYTQDTIGKEI